MSYCCAFTTESSPGRVAGPARQSRGVRTRRTRRRGSATRRPQASRPAPGSPGGRSPGSSRSTAAGPPEEVCIHFLVVGWLLIVCRVVKAQAILATDCQGCGYCVQCMCSDMWRPMHTETHTNFPTAGHAAQCLSRRLSSCMKDRHPMKFF